MQFSISRRNQARSVCVPYLYLTYLANIAAAYQYFSAFHGLFTIYRLVDLPSRYLLRYIHTDQDHLATDENNMIHLNYLTELAGYVAEHSLLIVYK